MGHRAGVMQLRQKSPSNLRLRCRTTKKARVTGEQGDATKRHTLEKVDRALDKRKFLVIIRDFFC